MTSYVTKSKFMENFPGNAENQLILTTLVPRSHTDPYLGTRIARLNMSLAMMSQAILTLVQSLSISGSYPSSSWIESDLKPVFTTLIKRLDSLHQDLTANEYSDGLLWVMVGVCLTGLVLWNLALTVVALQNQRTIRSIGQGLLFVSTKLEIRSPDSFPTAKF